MPTGQADRLMPTLRRVVAARQSAARSDGELLGAFVASGDADAFAELVRRHGPMVLGVCRRVVGDRTVADDAFQATFLVLVRRAAAVRPREQVGNWLYGVSYRTALKARMVLARRRSREKQVDVMPEPTAPTAPTVWSDLQPVIDEELAKLPDKLRVPIVLCDLEGRPQREVAKRLKVPPATLATRLASARRTLALRLMRRGVALSGGALAVLLGTHGSAAAVPPALTLGLVRAVELSATGGTLQSLVSANAVHLSEGIVRMMLLAKLKAVAVLAVTVLALTGGLGLGLVPASAGDEPVPGSEPAAKRAPANGLDTFRADRPNAPRAENAGLDDSTFLRRLCLDVRGTPPTDVETWFFFSDGDADKRAKLVRWLGADDAAKVLLAKKFGIPPERVRVVRLRGALGGQGIRFVVSERQEPGARASDTPAPPNASGRAFLVLADGAGHRDNATAKQPAPDPDAPAPKNKRKAGTIEGGNGVPFPLTNLVGEINGEMAVQLSFVIESSDSDTEFLKRVLTEVRGSGPTALELKYFTADKDPKKREKLLDTLLKEPDVQKKLGEAWKAKMLAGKPRAGKTTELSTDQFFLWVQPDGKQPDVLRLQVNPEPPAAPKPRTGFQLDGLRLQVNPEPPAAPKPPEGKQPEGLQWRVVPQPPAAPKPPQPPATAAAPTDKHSKLVGELIAAKKSDEAILEALTLATLSRLPTDNEKKIVLASIESATDRQAAWVAVAKALAGAEGPKKPGGFQMQLQFDQPPVPIPAKP